MILNATAQGQHWVNVDSATETFPANTYGGGTTTLANSILKNYQTVLVSCWDVAPAATSLQITDGNGTVLFTVPSVAAQLGIPRRFGEDGVLIPQDALTAVGGNKSWGVKLASGATLFWVVTFNIIRP